MKNKIHVHLGYYFPVTMMIMGGVAVLGGTFLLLSSPIYGVLLMIAGSIVLTARYRLEINLTQQTFHDYLWIAGFRKGEKSNFQNIEFLFVNKRNYRQQINSRVSTMTKYGVEYNGHIRFDTDDVHLLSSDSKAQVVRKLKKISGKLKGNIVTSTNISINATIIDYSVSDPIIIES